MYSVQNTTTTTATRTATTTTTTTTTILNSKPRTLKDEYYYCHYGRSCTKDLEEFFETARIVGGITSDHRKNTRFRVKGIGFSNP